MAEECTLPSFDNLDNLRYIGTDIACVEKQGTVIKMMPYTRNNGVAFIQSQGFISEYGIALARLANADREARIDYLHKDATQILPCNLGNLTDCDSSGIVIGLKVKGATRLGIDPDTINEINKVNEDEEDELDANLPVEIEDVEESNTSNTHWDALVCITNRTGKTYESLSAIERDYYYSLLRSRPKILGGDIRYVDYLEEKRIELNTILAVVKPQAFWNWLRWKMLQTWPHRSYLRGGLTLGPQGLQTPVMRRFTEYYGNHIESITKDRLGEERVNMRYVEGMYDDTDGFGDNVNIIQKAIMGDVMNEVVLPDMTVQKIDPRKNNEVWRQWGYKKEIKERAKVRSR